MNYQNPYKYKNKVDKRAKFVKKMSFQLLGIFIIMMILMLFKYSNTKITKNINEKVKNIFYYDYSDKTVEVFNSIPPYISNFLNKKTTDEDSSDDEFGIDYLPVDGKITDNYGQRVNPVTKKDEIHTGVDISAAEGTQVKAVLDGTVESVEETNDLGLVITINHGNGYETKYGHLSKANVTKDEKVVKGQTIALSGNTGISTGPHLHFEIIKDGKAVDPLDYMKNNV